MLQNLSSAAVMIGALSVSNGTIIDISSVTMIASTTVTMSGFRTVAMINFRTLQMITDETMKTPNKYVSFVSFFFQSKFILCRGSYMSVHVLLNLFKAIKCEFEKFNNTGALMVDSIYHVTLILLKKTHFWRNYFTF